MENATGGRGRELRGMKGMRCDEGTEGKRRN
jgi:hypothetical protein